MWQITKEINMLINAEGSINGQMYLLVVREWDLEITVRYHFASARLARIKIYPTATTVAKDK